MIVSSAALIQSLATSAQPAVPHASVALVDQSDFNADNPIICWHNVVTVSNITAGTTATGYPASNLANSATNSEWRANDTTEQYLTVDLASYEEEIDYLAVARHNFGSERIAVSVEGFYDATWHELVPAILPSTDAPIIFRFVPTILEDIRLRIQVGNAAARVAVIFVGKCTPLQRRIQVGHTPIVDGRKSTVITGRSESGRFLGRTVVSEEHETSVSLTNLLPGWYRYYLRPFIQAMDEGTFFFAWRPTTYPLETGYCWLKNNPAPVNDLPNGMMRVDFQLGGEVE